MMSIFEISLKLIGKVRPIGETNADEKSFENQKELENLIRDLVEEIRLISKEKDRCEFSISKSGKRAFWFLGDLRNDLTEIVGEK